MTASLRFDGALNVDLNEFQTNLVPFPRYAIKSDFFYILTLMKYLHIQGASKSFLDKKKIAGLAWKNNGNEIKWSRCYI